MKTQRGADRRLRQLAVDHVGEEFEPGARHQNERISLRNMRETRSKTGRTAEAQRPRRDAPGGVPALNLSRGKGARPAPKVVMAESLLSRLHDYVMKTFRSLGSKVEVGGMLVGDFRLVDGLPEFTIAGFIEAGPKAECCSG